MTKPWEKTALQSNFITSYEGSYALGISQPRGIITLTPKDDGSLLELTNWRPITLLNVDFKNSSKAIAKRFESIFPSLIQSDQTGFVTEDVT